MKNLTILLLSLMTLSLHASDFKEYDRKSFTTSHGKQINYRVLLPENMDSSKKYPLVLFLHGAGERGDDNVTQLFHGGGLFSSPVNRENYPAIVLFPQCAADKYWIFDNQNRPFKWDTVFDSRTEISSSLEAVKELLDSYLAMDNVDKSRVYVLGMSMGGMATYDMICRFPDTFAAAVPICGGVATERLKEVAGKVKVRIYHGDADDVVPLFLSRNAYIALKGYGADVEYHEFCGCGHDSWNPAFNMPDFLEWLFKQKK